MKFLKPLLLILAAAVVSVAINSDPVRATFYRWSQVAASDDSADPTINWLEGMAPSAVNNSGRAMMAALAKYRDDTSGKLVLAGTSTAYTVSSNQIFASLALMDGAELTFRIPAGTTSGASPTLNVDGLGAKALNQASSVAVATGALVAGAAYSGVYLNATSEWIVRGTSGTVPSGMKVMVTSSACPTGWTVDATFNDRTIIISSSAGGATGGTNSFTTAFSGSFASGGTAITQGNLPLFNFNLGSLTVSSSLDAAIQGTNTNIGTTSSYRASDGSGGAVSQQPTITSTVGGTISTGGANTAHTHTIPSVQWLSAISCTKN